MCCNTDVIILFPYKQEKKDSNINIELLSYNQTHESHKSQQINNDDNSRHMYRQIVAKPEKQ